MANREFKKIERIMKDFSLEIGSGSGASDKTHIGLVITHEGSIVSYGPLKVFEGDKEIEITTVFEHEDKVCFDAVVPLNKEITITYNPVYTLAETFYGWRNNFLDFEYSEKYEAYACTLTIKCGGCVFIEDFIIS